MTKFWLNIWTFLALAGYVGYAYWLYLLPRSTQQPNADYTFWKDASTLIIAVPAVWLGYCFTRRASFQKQLFDIWIRLVDAFEEGIQYTHYLPPDQPNYEIYARTLKQLSCMIEELRGAFKNVGGLYPYEDVKWMRDEIAKLRWSALYDYQRAPILRKEMSDRWKGTRKQLLKELDVVRPVYRKTAAQ